MKIIYVTIFLTIIVNFNKKDTTYNLEPGDILFLPVNKYHFVT